MMPVEIAEPHSLEHLSPPERVIGNEITEVFTTRRFTLILVLLILAAFPEVIFGAKTFLFRDYALFGYPLAHYHREAFWHGEIPLWNPLNNCGIPYLAQWNTMVCYPLSCIYLLLPLPWSLGWFCLLHLFLGGLGMFHLANRWTENGLAASVAGISYAFSGLMLACLIWPNNVAAMGWLPWTLLCVERGWNEGGRAVLKGAAVGAMQMLSGAPEIILLTWLIVAAFWGWEVCAAKADRWKLLLRLPIIMLTVGGLAAIQLLPFLDLLQHSQRSAQGASAIWSMPPWGWANLFVPLFRTTRTSMGAFLQPGQGWTSSYYLGIGPLVLALVALWKVRRPVVWLCGIVFALSAVLALGPEGHLFSWLQKIVPQMGFMRYPVKLVVLSAAVVPLLTALAVAHWQQCNNEEKGQCRNTMMLAASIAIGIIVALICFSFKFPGEGEQPRTTLFNGLSRMAALVAVLGFFFWIRSAGNSRRNWLVQFGLVGVVWLDLISHVPTQNPVVEAEAYQIGLPTLAQMEPRPQSGQSRALLSFQALEKFHTTIISNTFEWVLGVRGGMFENCNLIDGMPKIDGFYSLYVPEEQQVRFRLFASTNAVRSGLADFLGVSQVSSDANLLDWEPRRNAMPVMSGGQQIEFAGSDETLQALMNPDFDPRKKVYLPLEAKGSMAVSNSTPMRIVSHDFSSHRIRAEVETTGPSVLTIAQTHYHWWKAKVDDRATAVWRANHAFQALQVPAGRHRVEVVYEDRAFRTGRMISMATLIAFTVLFFGLKRRKKQWLLR